MSKPTHPETEAPRARRAEEIRRYLQTGDYDPHHAAWPGNVFESGRAARKDLTEALAAEVRGRSGVGEGKAASSPLAGENLVRFARKKLEPMVVGLFPRAEREPVLDALERSVVFLTDEHIETVLRESTWLHTSWTLANLYLGSIGAELLSDDAPRIVGLSEETTCYVSTDYFLEHEKFSDFVVHEAAHIFHNCKRRTVGLPETRRREWLLEIDFRKRETFAYACEAWSRIVALGGSPAERHALVSEFAAKGLSADEERVDSEELLAVLREAAGARNGWKRILSWCAPEARLRPRVGAGSFPRRTRIPQEARSRLE